MTQPVPVPQACPVSGVAICEYARRDWVEARFTHLEDAMELRHAAMDKAVALAHGTLEARLESMNQFRAQLERQAGGFVDRRAHEIVETRLNMLEQAAANLTGRVAMAVTAITLGFAILQVALHYFAGRQ